jgi:hypothetical protein
VLGTIGTGLVGELTEAKNTTPDAIVLQRLLAEYVKRGARTAAMEVSSHGLDQGRTAGLKFDVGVFTNLTRDHLDYHGTMEAYAEAKFRLFAARGLKAAVVNTDDEWGAQLAARLARARRASSPTAPIRRASLCASDIRLSPDGVRFQLQSDWGKAEVASGRARPLQRLQPARGAGRAARRRRGARRRGARGRRAQARSPAASSALAAASVRSSSSTTRTRPTRSRRRSRRCARGRARPSPGVRVRLRRRPRPGKRPMMGEAPRASPTT